MKQVAVLSLAALISGTAFATPILVTSDADQGPGSLRAAIAEASRGSSPQEIVVATEGDISLLADAVFLLMHAVDADRSSRAFRTLVANATPL
jgi:hypothetical protein